MCAEARILFSRRPRHRSRDRPLRSGDEARPPQCTAPRRAIDNDADAMLRLDAVDDSTINCMWCHSSIELRTSRVT